VDAAHQPRPDDPEPDRHTDLPRALG